MVTDAQVEAACRRFYDMKFGAGSWPNTSKHSIAEWRKRMRAALEAAEKAAWMQISEAPKDGTEILAFAQSSELLGRKFIGVAQWAEASDWLPGSVAGWFWPYAIRPTRFRTLSAPPEAR